jgi:hypothetical protein
MMETAVPIPGVLGEYPDRCVQAERTGGKSGRVSGPRPVRDARGGAVLSRTRQGGGILDNNPA